MSTEQEAVNRQAVSRQCIFCGESAGSREHIFANWMIERMGAKSQTIAMNELSEGQWQSRPAHTFNNFVTKRVCKKCNEGWMSELESKVKTVIGPLIDRQWPVLAETMMEEASREREIVARWALKTLICVDCSSMGLKTIRPEIAQQLLSGFLPSSMYVEFAHISQWGIGSMLQKVLRIKNADEPFRWQACVHGAFIGTIQLNHFAIRVFRCPMATPFYVPIENVKHSPFRIYPSNIRIPNAPFTYLNAQEFAGSLVFKTWLGHPM